MGSRMAISTAIHSDTHPVIQDLQLRLMREAPPWRKAELMGQMYLTMKQLALLGLRERYPQADEYELRRRLADLLLGSELAARVYGPGPDSPNAH